MATDDIKHLYQSNFNPDSYNDEYHAHVTPWVDIFMRKIYHLFVEGKLSGRRALDFGTGPSVHLMVIASKFCEEVTGCEFLEQNREQVKHFIKNDSQAFQWTAHLNLCAQIEGFSNVSEGAKEIAARLRNKFQDILPCDVTKEYPLEETLEPFDLLLTTFCLESAVTTSEEYVNIVRNMTTLVKPQGQILITGVLGATWYLVSSTRYPVCNVSKDLLKKAFSLANCSSDFYFECEDKGGESDAICDSNRYFVAVFTKM